MKGKKINKQASQLNHVSFGFAALDINMASLKRAPSANAAFPFIYI